MWVKEGLEGVMVEVGREWRVAEVVGAKTAVLVAVLLTVVTLKV